MNYYNEHDPDAAAILRVLIAEGLIAPGIVDERSIEDVRPDELAGYTQCHFFAGIGIWSLALRASGWPDDRPIWTGSCPCQPFSAAGKGDGFADERHLWPAFYHLISQCRPAEIRGEQVASKAVDAWIDLVHADLEALGYAFGSVPFPSAGVGAPHIRDRNYWAGRLADTKGAGSPHGGRGAVFAITSKGDGITACGLADTLLQQRPDGKPGIGAEHAQGGRLEGAATSAGFCSAERLADTGQERHDGRGTVGAAGGAGRGRVAVAGHADTFGRMADSDGGADGREGEKLTRANVGGLAQGHGGSVPGHDATGPTNGIWAAADWLLCRDGKWRPVEPGTFPLAPAGTFRNRVAALRGAGNAINLAAAQAFCEAVTEAA